MKRIKTLFLGLESEQDQNIFDWPLQEYKPRQNQVWVKYLWEFRLELMETRNARPVDAVAVAVAVNDFGLS